MDQFSFSRDEKFPTHYSDQHTAAHTDVLIAGIITAFCIIVIPVVLVLPAYNSEKRYIFLFSYTVISLLIGSLTTVTNYGHSWEVAKASIKSPYTLGSPDEIQGEIKLNIALRGINITLKGEFLNDTVSKTIYGAVVDYNEGFSWEWEQGRFGFGPYAGRMSREFRAGVIRGLPVPILQLAEYFTIDGEGIRFGRHYRLAGWYAQFFMWCAFVAWITSNILFFIVVQQGAVLLVITGIFQLISVLIWTLVRNSIELQVPFESKNGHDEVMLKTNFGTDYYLVIANSLICITIGLLIYTLDFFYPQTLLKVFGIDPLSAFDEILMTRGDRDKIGTLRHQKVYGSELLLHPIENRRLNIQNQNGRAFSDRHDELVSIKTRKNRIRSYIPASKRSIDLI